ncbi:MULTISPECIES: NAD(P)H-binding protein [unclassified Luteococcus]|uniref:NAD(P)H-binding protein n=1 Tax=unclassified Luteococcus TaxID=2639923 RepID=UPI00313A7BD9
MTKITVIGAHGKVALLALPPLVQAENQVDGIIRNPHHAPDIAQTGATPVVADVEHMSTQELTDLLRGSDAIVWSAGAGGGNPQRTYAVDRDAAIRSMQAAEAAGVKRYVMVSYFGAGPDHGISPENSFFAYAEAKSAADEHLMQTQLDWTVLRPSKLTLAEPTGRIDTAAQVAGEVSRANVARVIAAVVAEPGTIGKVIAFNDGETPVQQAITA